MPELPEVRTISEELNRTLQGKSIASIRWDDKSRITKGGLGGYDVLSQFLPLRIEKIYNRGKKIVFVFEGSIYLISFLGLEGHWNWIQSKHSNLSLEICTVTGPLLIEEPTLYYTDSRHFGTFKIGLNQSQLQEQLKTTGPDFFSEELTLEKWRQIYSAIITKIVSGRLKNRQVCQYLMDQTHFSGIGNYIKAEVLYETRIRPDRMITDLTPEELEALYSVSKRIIRESYESQGLTIATYWSPNGNKGTFTVKVYKKSLDPYGNQIIAETFADQRTTHWVPQLQK